MSDDQETTQNTTTLDSSPTTVSEPAETPSEALNASTDVVTPVAVKDGNSGVKETESTPENGGIQAVEPAVEPVSEPVQSSETRTAQIPANEPFTSEPEAKFEPLKTEPENLFQPKISLARELLIKARNMIQFRKRKKLDRVMTLFDKKKNGSTSSPQVTNDEVREFLHVSDATAERYLNALEKENKLKQVGKTGKGVSYSKI